MITGERTAAFGRVRHGLLALTVLVGLACFDGHATVGSICFNDNQCGHDQRCVNAVCGLCGDLEVQVGELCFGNSAEAIVFGEVSDLAAFSRQGDVKPAMVAVVNNNCQDPPLVGPPLPSGPSCWNLFIGTIRDDGDFEPVPLFATKYDGRVRQLAVGNFDGNDDPDIAVAIAPNDPLANATQIGMLYDFPKTEVSFNINISVIPRTLHAADLNGDGLADLLIGGEASSALALLLATPGGGFAPERLLVTDPSPRPAAPVDMDNDGDLDVVLLSATNKTIGVNLNNGAGNFSPRPRLELGEHLVAAGLATADFDRDGIMDVVVFAPAEPGSGATSEIIVYRGLGNGDLEELVRLPGGRNPVTGLAVDLNADGWPDIVIADMGNDKLPVYINRGGSFPDQVRIDVAAGPRTLIFGDLNGNGLADIVVGTANGVVSVVPSEN